MTCIGTDTIYYGVSASATPDETAVLAMGTAIKARPRGRYEFTSATPAYLVIAIPDDMTQPQGFQYGGGLVVFNSLTLSVNGASYTVWVSPYPVNHFPVTLEID